MACTDSTDSIALAADDGILTADLIVAPSVGVVPNLLDVDADGVRVEGADGWIPLPATLTQTTATGNLISFNTSVNLSTLLVPGQKIKFTQNSLVHVLTLVTVGAGIVAYLLDGTTVDASAITLPYFELGGGPVGAYGVGPLVVDTGDDVFDLYYTTAGWRSHSEPAWASANAAASTRSANTYANMTAAGYSARQLPFKALYDNGLAWEFRWTAGISYGAGQTSAGVRLTAIAADLASSGGSQDTTNIFGEVTSFTAAAEVIKDSGWVALNTSIAKKDMLVIMPQFKSDGTRTVTISLTDAFSVRARVYLP